MVGFRVVIGAVVGLWTGFWTGLWTGTGFGSVLGVGLCQGASGYFGYFGLLIG